MNSPRPRRPARRATDPRRRRSLFNGEIKGPIPTEIGELTALTKLRVPPASPTPGAPRDRPSASQEPPLQLHHRHVPARPLRRPDLRRQGNSEPRRAVRHGQLLRSRGAPFVCGHAHVQPRRVSVHRQLRRLARFRRRLFEANFARRLPRKRPVRVVEPRPGQKRATATTEQKQRLSRHHHPRRHRGRPPPRGHPLPRPQAPRRRAPAPPPVVHADHRRRRRGRGRGLRTNQASPSRRPDEYERLLRPPTRRPASGTRPRRAPSPEATAARSPHPPLPPRASPPPPRLLVGGAAGR